MSPLGTFLLALAALVGLITVLKNPLYALEKSMRGKSTSQLKEEWSQKIEDTDASTLVGKGCGCLSYVLIGMLYTFVIEPLVVILALMNNIGDRNVAWVMLAIVALAWFSFARSIIKGNKKQPVVKDAAGEIIEGAVVEEIYNSSPAWTAFKRGVFAAPTLYLWYVFAVVIGIISA